MYWKKRDHFVLLAGTACSGYLSSLLVDNICVLKQKDSFVQIQFLSLQVEREGNQMKRAETISEGSILGAMKSRRAFKGE